MRVFDELHFLEIFFQDVHRKGHTDVVKLYETVQHAGNVLTRLYVFQVARHTHARTHARTQLLWFLHPRLLANATTTHRLPQVPAHHCWLCLHCLQDGTSA